MKMELNEPLIKKIKIDFEENAVDTNCVEYKKINNPTEDKNLNKKENYESFRFKTDEKLESNSTQNFVNKIQISEDMIENCGHKSSSLNRSKTNSNKKIFIYGNYSGYYGYRNEKGFQDVRLDVFSNYKDLFEGKEIFDIGCNSGIITMKLAENFNIKYIIGIDIDKTLINRAIKLIEKKRRNIHGRADNRSEFPFNIKFLYGNYVLKNDVLLEIEREQFDLILCLSVTKWIHLNFGDSGLKQAFKRMFLQLRRGGHLILEPQPYNTYRARRNLTLQIKENYKNIKFLPEHFTEYLLGPEIGFCEMKLLDTPQHPSKGFMRPLQLFYKK